MLNGVDPVILFNLKINPTKVSSAFLKIPIVADIVSAIDLPVIPIYLSEQLTGLYIDTESKDVEVSTDTDTLTSGGTPETNQRAISSTVKINMIAKKGSLGALILSSMIDLIYPKLTSKEYSISYLHGGVTVFGGLLHSFSGNQNSENDLYNISLELIKPAAAAATKNTAPQVQSPTNGVDLKGPGK